LKKVDENFQSFYQSLFALGEKLPQFRRKANLNSAQADLILREAQP